MGLVVWRPLESEHIRHSKGNLMADKFYAYMWLRDDGTPYYIGKGTSNRAFVDGSHNVPCPKDPARIVVFARSSEVEAFATEIELIAMWGRKDLGTGCLRNFTDGGDGVSGLNHSDESRKKMSFSAAGRTMSEVQKQKISAAMAGKQNRLGTHQTAEMKEKVRHAMLGNHHSPGWPKGKSRKAVL